MNRRGFLGAMLAAATAPAVVRASSLMKVVTLESGIVAPLNRLLTLDEVVQGAMAAATLWGDGVHDDTQALQAVFDGEQVMRPDGSIVGNGFLTSGSYKISSTLLVRGESPLFVSGCNFDFHHAADEPFIRVHKSASNKHFVNSSFQTVKP